MKPHEQCKKAGLKNLAELIKKTGVSKQTLINWHKTRPELFSIVITGVARTKNGTTITI